MCVVCAKSRIMTLRGGDFDSVTAYMYHLLLKTVVNHIRVEVTEEFFMILIPRHRCYSQVVASRLYNVFSVIGGGTCYLCHKKISIYANFVVVVNGNGEKKVFLV